MKTKVKREYEVFNLETGTWEKRIMSDKQYKEFTSKMNANVEELDAEYEIVSRIVAHKMGVEMPPKKSMD
tara:strand:- start:7446 stop:7655 length:210 start_codon:yes stop_codon:yes gene_type:complete